MVMYGTDLYSAPKIIEGIEYVPFHGVKLRRGTEAASVDDGAWRPYMLGIDVQYHTSPQAAIQ